MRVCRFTGLLFMLLFLTLEAVHAQRLYLDVARQFSRAEAYSEVLLLPRAEALVLFRIPHSRLIFMQQRLPGGHSRFQADVEVTAAVYAGDRRMHEATWQGTRTVSTFEATQDNLQDLIGGLRLRLSPGTYRLNLTVHDRHADTSWPLPPRQLHIPAGDTLPLPWWIAPPEQKDSSLTLNPFMLGERIPFGQPASAALWLPATYRGTLHYRLERLPAPSRSSFRKSRSSSRSSANHQPPSVPRFPVSPDTPGTLVFEDSLKADAGIPFDSISWTPAHPEALTLHPSDTGAYRLLVLNLRGETLDDGYYRLTLSRMTERGPQTQHVLLATHWREMPLPLRNVDLAIETLRFIVNRKTLRRLKKGSPEEREANLRAFWKARDPSPETPYNELMAEYYRRVDYAARAFRTGHAPVPDGLETDRARIYIQYGPPASIERTLMEKGQGVREIWHYPDGRTFIFEAATSLDPFVLVSRHPSPHP